jgi:hypothetical protein
MLQEAQPVAPQEARRQLRLVVFHDGPRVWRARGLEHDFVVEGRTIGEVVRLVVRLVEAHTAFDIRHHHTPMTAFLPAPEHCWSAYKTGIPVSLTQLGVAPPEDWDIHAVVAYRHPIDGGSADRQKILP